MPQVFINNSGTPRKYTMTKHGKTMSIYQHASGAIMLSSGTAYCEMNFEEIGRFGLHNFLTSLPFINPSAYLNYYMRGSL